MYLCLILQIYRGYIFRHHKPVHNRIDLRQDRYRLNSLYKHIIDNTSRQICRYMEFHLSHLASLRCIELLHIRSDGITDQELWSLYRWDNYLNPDSIPLKLFEWFEDQPFFDRLYLTLASSHNWQSWRLPIWREFL